jgi:spore coat protein A, manganese oxidase
VVCSSCVARSGRPALFPLAYARYAHPLDQEAHEGCLIVPQEEASQDANQGPANADLLKQKHGGSCMAITRKEFLKLGLVAGGAGLALSCGASATLPGGRGNATTGKLLRSAARLPKPFRVSLPVPAVLEPARSDDDADHYEITQKVAKAEILPGLKTELWAYEGSFPGPTIESRSGRVTIVRQINKLPVPVSTHLHGGRTPPSSDGFPTDLILPRHRSSEEHSPHAHHGNSDRPPDRPLGNKAGWSFHRGSKDYFYPLEQRAATLWYHDHRMDFSGPQLYRGLAGFLIIGDKEEAALPLPKDDKDVPLMICDRAFDDDGSFIYPSLDPSLQDKPGVKEHYMEGVLGDAILVNGVPWPFMEVSNTRYRFRILNASNARRYRLALEPERSDGLPFVQVGSDGGLLGSPISHRTLTIAPAERFDVVIDFSKYPVGTKVTLKNRLGLGTTSRVMRFHVVRKEKEQSTVPKHLSDMSAFEALGESSPRHTRKFYFTQDLHNGQVVWTINGKVFDPTRIDVRPKLGSTEIWEFTTDLHHPIHLHLVQFKVVSRNGKRPLPKDAGWKDTVDVLPGQVVRVISRFDGYRGRYVFHCHNLEHEDMMMMANFGVV